jgi:hypothetical protein
MDIKLALRLNDEQKIRDEILLRQNQMKDMVGWLYPNILSSEIHKLYDRIQWINTSIGDFQI